MKTITVQDSTWQNLTRLKVGLMAESLDDLINRILRIVQKFKLAKELEENGKAKKEKTNI